MKRIDGISDEEMLSAMHEIEQYFKELSDEEMEREWELSDAVWDLQHGTDNNNDPNAKLSDEEISDLIGRGHAEQTANLWNLMGR